MSMYTTLLDTALGQRDRSVPEPSPGDLLARLARSRASLVAGGVRAVDQAHTLEAVIRLLDYDVSLIDVARSLGIPYAIDRFDDGERQRLEDALRYLGIPPDLPAEPR